MSTALVVAGLAVSSAAAAPDDFFESRIRPVLATHCYSCHSAKSKSIKGGLRLDLREGWRRGGSSGEPAIVPGDPDASPLLRAVRHDDGYSAMPPEGPRLPDKVLADLTEWVRRGAPDPRSGTVAETGGRDDWESEFARRLDWWSLQPVRKPKLPAVRRASWPRTGVDRFILARLEADGLQPAPQANPRALARRLSFALTGLPPQPAEIERLAADMSATAYASYVDTLLSSPRFGERWARHWMDVVHYADTHGYEWDVPAKNAWRYRDYLVRAFNQDIPYRRLLMEQLAGDLLDARIDEATGVNESLIGPMMLRLGERRHGDNAAAEGVTQEAVSNMIDTIGKGLIATTLACAQCHNHKLDAVSQRDYYALAGTLMSTRFSARSIETNDVNLATIEQLRTVKGRIRAELARQWRGALEDGKVAEAIRAIPADKKPPATFPQTLLGFWKRSLAKPVTATEFAAERKRRQQHNTQHVQLAADFSQPDGAPGWRWDGWGMQHGLVKHGTIVVADEGDGALVHLLPAGRYSHVWSPRLAGLLQSPQFDPLAPVTFSIEVTAGKFSSQSFIVDRALHSERLLFMNYPTPRWLTLTAGNFSSLEGTPDRGDRRVYLELATKSLNNYFPPRVGYRGVSEAEERDPRSWFGASRVLQHPSGKPPLDELDRFEDLFDALGDREDWSQRLVSLLRGAVDRWASGGCSRSDVRLLNDALQSKLLPQQLSAGSELALAVAEYRAHAKRLRVDRTIGSADDWYEGRNARVGLRGSYTKFGAEVERGHVRLLGRASTRNNPQASGRLAIAERIADGRNPLTARVYVNRIWHYLFGEGLVRTPDDFGHLGEQPTHPELLDYLADRFMADGWSTKKLIRELVTSSVWRQQSVASQDGVTRDPENRSWHHYPLRRLDAESIRDSLLAVSGRYDREMFGPPIEPHRTAEDAKKRLFAGPLDGRGRRSVYLEMTMMEPPRFLALFNQPLPKQTVGRRDVTNVPDQALALLNDPFVIEMADRWSRRLVTDGAANSGERATRMLAKALGRPPQPTEVDRLVGLVARSAALHGVLPRDTMSSRATWRDAAHAVFNLKEFIYVP